MTLTLFMTLLTSFALIVSLITEALKATFKKLEVGYSANVLVLIVSLFVGAGGTAIVYLYLGIAFTTLNILCIALMAVAVWVGAMVGYDKVLQMIEQIKGSKLK